MSEFQITRNIATSSPTILSLTDTLLQLLGQPYTTLCPGGWKGTGGSRTEQRRQLDRQSLVHGRVVSGHQVQAAVEAGTLGYP